MTGIYEKFVSYVFLLQREREQGEGKAGPQGKKELHFPPKT